jgi:hypothetical protein
VRPLTLSQSPFLSRVWPKIGHTGFDYSSSKIFSRIILLGLPRGGRNSRIGSERLPKNFQNSSRLRDVPGNEQC